MFTAGGSGPAAGGGGGGSGPAAGGVQVQLAGGSGPAARGVRSSCRGGSGPAGGRGCQSSQQGGGQVQLGGGVSILHPLAGGMPLAFMQEDFLVLTGFVSRRMHESHLFNKFGFENNPNTISILYVHFRQQSLDDLME